jgi:nitroimidazol reductase NimA-like FMN-containing flavoprotein (pyridoxamine 5'-phosphate oxidase superfamily)
MGVRLSDEEAWAYIEAAHTGTLSTLRRDGWPVSLPVWFVVRDRRIYLSTPARTKKVARVRHDERGCFQVESGEAWRELAAVVMPVRASVVQDGGLAAEMAAAVDEKYAAFRTPASELPERTRAYYDQEVAVIALEPTGRIVSWDNARLFGA